MLDAVVLAIALSMDATAVAAACGAAGVSTSMALRMAAVFATFHVAMVSIGWSIGHVAESWVEPWDHWIAFALLAVIGGKMVVSAMRSEVVAPPVGWRVLLGLAFATSLDAVAAGVTLPLVDAPELVVIALIGGVVFVFVLVAARIGALLGDRFGRGLQIAGGLAIIGLGAKLLLDHLG
ncbi:MAG: manganese efflux pump [Deltaproteobacteria bacterium]|nr:manganese efflux pump [Deltaproteobacteria bacterium]